jgi:hypothetical protein
VRREADFFSDQELDLLYMSRRLREALKLEALLTDAGFDYLVETGTYTGGFLIKRDLTGAFFYVSPSDLIRARTLLIKKGYQPYDTG